MRFGLGMKCELDVGGAPRIDDIYGLNRAWHLHLGRWHVQENSLEGIVLSGVRPFTLLSFIGVKHLVVGWASNVFVSA